MAPLPGIDSAKRRGAPRRSSTRATRVDDERLRRSDHAGRPGTALAAAAPLSADRLLTATAVYLGGVSPAEVVTGASYQGYVYQWTVLVHLAVGSGRSCCPSCSFALGARAGRPDPSQPARRPHGLRAGRARGRRAGQPGSALLRVAGIELRQPGARADRLLGCTCWPRSASPGRSSTTAGAAAPCSRGAAWTWAAATAALVALTAAIDVRTSRPPAVTDGGRRASRRRSRARPAAGPFPPPR